MFQDTMKEKMDEVRGMRRDDILAALGLARRNSLQNAWLPAVGLFAAGIAVGTGVALLLAPKTGRDIRHDLRDRARDFTRRVGRAKGAVQDAAGDVRATLEEEKESLRGQLQENVENGARDWRVSK